MVLKDRILDPPVFMAPMAGITRAEFRRFVSKFGASMVVSEMISVEGLIRKDRKSWQYVKVNKEIEALEVFQIFGSNEASFRNAARMLFDQGVQCIDINAGCPVPKVVRQGGGAALLKNPDKLFRIVEAVRSSVNIPVTVKLRLGWDDKSINILDIAKELENIGVDAIVLHARTAKQLYSGTAKWEWIKKVKTQVRIPVVGNGDVVSVTDALRMFKETECDGVMIGRGALGNPWLFQALAAHIKPCRWKEPKDDWNLFFTTVVEYVEELAKNCNHPGYIRRVLMWFSKGCPEASYLRGEIIKQNTVSGMMKKFEEWFDRYVISSGIPFLKAKKLVE